MAYELKIDQSFVQGCATDPDMLKIIEGSVGLARAFKMKVVAEGIDDLTTLAVVRNAGCHIGQGHLFAPSLRLEGVEAWMARRDENSQSFPGPGRKRAVLL